MSGVMSTGENREANNNSNLMLINFLLLLRRPTQRKEVFLGA
jgi:hypothetical protein